MIKAEVLEISRRGVTLDTGLRPARVSRADLTADSIIGTTVANSTPRKHGEDGAGGRDVPQLWGGGIRTTHAHSPLNRPLSPSPPPTPTRRAAGGRCGAGVP